ncbi:MAG: DUF1643 domain-containing protein [Pseudomonadota bacterium]
MTREAVGAKCEGGAEIAECGRYRYGLWRKWGPGPICTFVMLNPSTADAVQDDPTIRRCISFAKREGCDAVLVKNLFAYRATKPADMMAADDPIGPGNDADLRDAIRMAERHCWTLIAAWGAHPFAQERGKLVASWGKFQCLKKSKSGAAGHPLYIKGDARLVAFNSRDAISRR